MSTIRINGQVLPPEFQEISIKGGHVELDGAHICCTDNIEVEIKTDLSHLSPALREYVERGIRANEP